MINHKVCNQSDFVIANAASAQEENTQLLHKFHSFESQQERKREKIEEKNYTSLKEN